MANKETLEAVEKTLEDSKKQDRNFKQNIDMVVNLKNVDLNDPNQRIEEEIVLPNGRGKKAKVGLFASGELALKSKDKVDKLIKPEELEDLSEDKKQAKKIAEAHDFFLAEAPLMPTIGKALGQILGPRGKMPKPIPLDADVSDTVEKLRKTVIVRSKTKQTFHTIVGTEDMDKEKIAENVDTILRRVIEKLEYGKMNVRSVYIKPTMGKSQKII
ncbi:MAG: 50S ribosomal protein L1 [Candidatus Thermoplasmatota archaeon]